MAKKLVYDIYNVPHMLAVCTEISSKIRDGKRFVARFEEVTRCKSLKQLRNLFGNIITPVSEYLSSEYGQEIDGLSLERKLLDIYNTQAEEPSMEYTFDFETKQPEVIPTRLSAMSTAQAADFTDWLINFIRGTFPELQLPPYLDYLWMNRLTAEKIRQVEYEERKFSVVDEAYRRYLREKPCIVCGKVSVDPDTGELVSIAHHLRDVAVGSGVAQKVPDYYTVPLCNHCHQMLHDEGTSELSELIAPVLHGYELALFCKFMYFRWVNHL